MAETKHSNRGRYRLTRILWGLGESYLIAGRWLEGRQAVIEGLTVVQGSGVDLLKPNCSGFKANIC